MNKKKMTQTEIREAFEAKARIVTKEIGLMAELMDAMGLEKNTNLQLGFYLNSTHFHAILIERFINNLKVQ